MANSSVSSMLLSSTNPERLHAWYAAALSPTDDAQVDTYRILKFGEFYLMIDTRTDVTNRNPEPGRMILNFDVDDARVVADRLDSLSTTWLAELEDRDGSFFATAVDPDGNYVQIVQISEEHRKAMEQSQAAKG